MTARPPWVSGWWPQRAPGLAAVLIGGGSATPLCFAASAEGDEVIVDRLCDFVALLERHGAFRRWPRLTAEAVCASLDIDGSICGEFRSLITETARELSGPSARHAEEGRGVR